MARVLECDGKGIFPFGAEEWNGTTTAGVPRNERMLAPNSDVLYWMTVQWKQKDLEGLNNCESID